ncbi:DUF3618 domain-containing protein [Mycobacterium yunnanensis]|uniref:DUF3618 domain-containing protein n=1 Tax=Mycobacterium yunnanensis TaxID=368477 RepID=A0A9X3BT99_9MYCO|nr:DUF3618 domain-containing protein [Mycobacterium yunnanensis]MCV7420905.1 DUF3618 domain-containing protein [Mycobacterium yunnanensis]
MTGPDPTPAEPGPEAGIDELQADIEATRAELGDTARALTDKLDVKARASDAVTGVKRDLIDSTTTPEGTVKPSVAAVVAVVLLTIGVVVWRRRRR